MFKSPTFWLILFGFWLLSAVVSVFNLLVNNSLLAVEVDSPVVAAVVFGLVQIGGLVAGVVLYRRRPVAARAVLVGVIVSLITLPPVAYLLARYLVSRLDGMG